MTTRSSETRLIARCALTLAFALATYASLRPFNWSASRSGRILDFLLHPQLASAGAWDVALNLAGYGTLGALGVLAFAHRRRRVRTAAVTVIALALYSVAMETLQNFLPSRTPSAMDVTANVVGAALGALLGLIIDEALHRLGGIVALRHRLFEPGLSGALGIVLIGAWLLGLLAPRTLLYGSGDLRVILGVPAGAPLPGAAYIGIEAALAAANLFAVALFLRAMLRTRAPFLLLFAAMVILSLASRSIGFGLFWTAPAAFDWLTPGAKLGLGAGLCLAVLARQMPARAARTVAAAVLALSTVAVNVAPPNPRTWMAPRPSRQDELAPISAVTRVTAGLWPFAAILWAAWPRRRRDTGRVSMARASSAPELSADGSERPGH